MKITKRQLRRIIREESGSTKKYDNDSALKGKQSELPDALQKSIIDKVVKDREDQDKKDLDEEDTEDTSVIGKNKLFKGNKMSRASGLSTSLSYSTNENKMKISEVKLRKLIKEELMK
jgi:hypothetical protein